ncbi:MAG: flagellar biosynthetic protein FliR [Planctomycetes bacterium]|nr:flagellar biosynthetic protein FliR [Planctomycetota bacterium]
MAASLELVDWSAGQLRGFALVYARVAALLVTAPGFGQPVAPARLRLALALGVALVLAPALGLGPLDGGPGDLAAALAREALLGAALGLGVTAMMAGVRLAGVVLDQAGGFGLGGALDPNREDGEGPLGRFQALVALLAFVLVDGHHLLLNGLAASFRAIPPAGVRFDAAGATLLADGAVGLVFDVALRVCAPLLGAALVATLTLALAAKVVPELNVFLHGAPVLALVGLAAFALVLPVVTGTVAQLAGELPHGIEGVLRAFK